MLKSNSLLNWFVDPFRPTYEQAEEQFRFTGSQRSWLIPLVLGIAMLVLSAVGWVIDPHQFYFSYLVGWVFCLAFTLGALFFTLIHHITKAHWSVVVRRVPEALAWGFPLLAIFSIPIILGMHDLYHWTHEGIADPGSPDYDEILAGKVAYLNTPFWLARMAVYFIIWTYIAYKLSRLSLLQDLDPDPSIPAKQRRISAWGIPVFAITLAFASYDILMALDPHWFSTMFGVYFFAGSFFAATALITLILIFLQKQGGMLRNVVTVEHYHDLGKWMFCMTAFWAYISFSQYMLIWYSGIPEETVFFRHRFEHGWEWHSYSLIFLHFALPFLILLLRATKRSLTALSVMAVWFLVIQWFDHHWVAMPVLHADHASIHWMSITCWLGLTLLFVGAAVYRLSRHSLIPQNDPRLAMSLQFENV